MAKKTLPEEVEQSPAGWALDNAIEEESNWDNESALKNQENRNKIWVMKTIGYIVPCVIIVLSLLFIASFISWSLHFLLPEYFHWLEEYQLSKIQSIIFSGAMGAIVSSYIKNHISS